MLCCAIFCYELTASAENIWIDQKLSIDSTKIKQAAVEATILEPDSSLRYKLMVTHGEQYYYYDLYPEETAVIPLQMGKGAYKFQLYEQAYDNYYNPVGKTKIYLSSKDENQVWLEPNVKVNYTAYTDRLLTELKKWVSPDDSEKIKFQKISNVARYHYGYDYLAVIRKRLATYVDLDYILTNYLGTCEELSVLAVAFFRLEGIPARLVIGKADGRSHAWVEALINGKIKLLDPSVTEYVQPTVTYIPERYY